MKSKMMLCTALLAFTTVSAMGCTTERVVVRDAAPDRVVVVKAQPGPDQVVVVAKRPPAPRREIRPRRPSLRHVWVGGHWAYRGSRYVWVQGRWTVPPRHGARWVAAHWTRRHGGWVFVAGYWR